MDGPPFIHPFQQVPSQFPFPSIGPLGICPQAIWIYLSAFANLPSPPPSRLLNPNHFGIHSVHLSIQPIFSPNKMHQFHRYDPAQPRTVTSFKGNQKLIFEGYRYNIHHIVPIKGVKTWRCVCAKKLNGSRSWCKGRAETWDGDSQGVSKGEHNHPPEHEVAELDFFRSQLILAAISSPQANLNDLIDEAIALMSDGVSFGSRESLKKSLTGARKQAENGGLKLKCYKSANKPIKNLAYNKLVRPLPIMGNGEEEKMANEEKEGEKNGTAGNVLQLLALAKASNEVIGKNKTKQNHQGPFNECQTPFSSPGSFLDSSGFQSASSTFSSTFSSSPSDLHQSNNSALLMTMVAAAAAAALGNNGGIGGKKGGGALTNNFDCRKQNQKQQSVTAQSATVSLQCQQQNTQIIQRKKARVNSIFNRLSTKAAAAAATSSSSNSTSASSGHSSPSSEMKINELMEFKATEHNSTMINSRHQRKAGKKMATSFAAAGTQTEEMEEMGKRTSQDSCKCQVVVRVCCCGNRANCTGGQKRKWTETEEDEAKVDMDGEEENHHQQERSPPPSSCSSVENQPQNHQHGQQQLLISSVKEETE